MTDEEIRVWLAFALLDGESAWWEIHAKPMHKLIDLGYITVTLSPTKGRNKLVVTDKGRQFLEESNHGQNQS